VTLHPTLKDVAAKAGVHPSTVSRVLRDKEHPLVSPETRERILAVARELDYQPDQVARSLRLRKSHTIGLIIPDISNPFFAEIARSIEVKSNECGYSLIVCNTNEDQGKEDHFISNLLSRGLDGLIIAPVQDSDQHIRELIRKQFPFVLIDRCFEHLQTNAVISDNQLAAFRAVSYLVENGHRRIGFVGGRRGLYTIQKRLQGYREAVAHFNLDDNEALIAGTGFTFESGYTATRSLIALPEPPTAVLVSGNMISFGAVKAIQDAGWSVPEDISVIGFTDHFLASMLSSPLTSISHSLKKMGSQAFELLFEHMNGSEVKSYSTKVLETELVLRASVAAVDSHHHRHAYIHEPIPEV